jgi:hypothetical protein
MTTNVFSSLQNSALGFKGGIHWLIALLQSIPRLAGRFSIADLEWAILSPLHMRLYRIKVIDWIAAMAC